MLDFLLRAAEIAAPKEANKKFDKRGFWLGCVGIRYDGVRVESKNIAMISKSSDEYERNPHIHAEGRTLKKMGKGGIIYVARVSKIERNLVMARPCPACQILIRAHRIEKVYYTVNNTQYGILDIPSNSDYVITCLWTI